MENALIAMGIGILVLVASMTSVELGISVALTEILLGIVGGNFLVPSFYASGRFPSWLYGIVLTFLAGAEVDPDLMLGKLKESLFIGGISFLAPFIGTWLFSYYLVGWTRDASAIAATALSTTSLAVVYAVLVETGLTSTALGKLIMASCFITKRIVGKLFMREG